MARGRRRGPVRRAGRAAARRARARRPRPPRRLGRLGRGRAGDQARGDRRHLRTALESGDRGRHPGAVAAGRRRLGRLAGRLRPAAAVVPGRRLADAQRRRPRPGPAPLPDRCPRSSRTGAGASVPAMPQIIAANRGFHESPDWGLLGSLAGCATAVGPGRGPRAGVRRPGAVASYLPSAGGLSAGVLARCPLTVVDLGQIGGIERTAASAVDRQLSPARGRPPGRHPAPGHLARRGGRGGSGGAPPAPRT